MSCTLYYSIFTRVGKLTSTPTCSATASRMSLCWSTVPIMIFCRALAFSISRVKLSRRRVISSIWSLSPRRSWSWNSSLLVPPLKRGFGIVWDNKRRNHFNYCSEKSQKKIRARDRNTEPVKVVDITTACLNKESLQFDVQSKQVVVLFFNSSLYFLKQIENTFFVFLSSYRNARKSLGDRRFRFSVCVPTAFSVSQTSTRVCIKKNRLYASE